MITLYYYVNAVAYNAKLAGEEPNLLGRPTFARSISRSSCSNERPMRTIILRRLAALLPTALLGSLIIFGIVHLTPGGPAAAIAGPDAGPEVIARSTRNWASTGPSWFNSDHGPGISPMAISAVR